MTTMMTSAGDSECRVLVRVAGKTVRKDALRLYSLFFKEIEAKSAEFST